MFEFARSFLATHTRHPLLASLLLIAGLFVVAAVTVEQTVGNAVASAFLVVYAIIAVTLSLFGYLVIALGNLVTKVRRRMSVAG